MTSPAIKWVKWDGRLETVPKSKIGMILFRDGTSKKSESGNSMSWSRWGDNGIATADDIIAYEESGPIGFLSGLSDDQRAAALAYRGDDLHGAEQES